MVGCLQVIVLTTFWLVLIGISSFVTNRIAKEDGDGAGLVEGNTTNTTSIERAENSIERAETLDFWIESILAIIYVVANVVIFIPAWMKQRREVRLLTKDDPDAINIGAKSGSPIKRPTVHKDAKYVTWKSLKAKNTH